MATRNSEMWHGCPARYCSAVFGDQWTLLIMRDLLLKRARRYADFLDGGEGIATNVLASRLAHLEKEGMIIKSTDPDHGARKIYTATDKALDIIPMMIEMIEWAARWDKDTEVPPALLEEIKRDRVGLVKRLRAVHKKSE